MTVSKKWGWELFWGLNYNFDPQWMLTPAQQELQAKLIDLCASTLRPNAIESDAHLIYPRKNLEAMTSLGLLGLLVPKKWGGLGENHTCAAMVVETIARYGCPSTAMCYIMHLVATAIVLLRAQSNPELQKLLQRLERDVFIGTLSYSDPATGSHFWYPVCSQAEQVPEGWKVSKQASWTTSAGFADWYLVETISPGFDGDYSDLSCFLLYADEVQAEPEKWDALGLRGNQSGTLLVEQVTIPPERLVGSVGDAKISNDETTPFFLLLISACNNGIAMGAIDIAKRHTTKKKHIDLGMRVADYPTIQDYFGEAISDTNASRCFTYSLAKLLDDVTNNCDWSIHQDLTAMPRAAYGQWFWQLKFTATKNVESVGDRMLHACGGTGFKKELGLERYLRDGKAGWLMAPTNEVLRQLVGKLALLGIESLDLWNQSVNQRVLHNELKKMNAAAKKQLAEKLLAEVAEAEKKNKFANNSI